MARIRLILRAAAGVLAFVTYVWFAAVRLLPWVKRRKRERRVLRTSRGGERRG